jgi:hypothetical protein
MYLRISYRACRALVQPYGSGASVQRGVLGLNKTKSLDERSASDRRGNLVLRAF